MRLIHFVKVIVFFLFQKLLSVTDVFNGADRLTVWTDRR